MTIFDAEVKRIEKAKNSLVEVIASLKRMKEVIKARKVVNFISLKVKSLLQKLTDEGVSVEFFLSDVGTLYTACEEYLEKWAQQFSEFECFSWMILSKKPLWSDCEECVLYLQGKKVHIDDVKLFDQFQTCAILWRARLKMKRLEIC